MEKTVENSLAIREHELMTEPEKPAATAAPIEEIQRGWHELASRVGQLEAERSALQQENKDLRFLLGTAALAGALLVGAMVIALVKRWRLRQELSLPTTGDLAALQGTFKWAGHQSGSMDLIDLPKHPASQTT